MITIEVDQKLATNMIEKAINQTVQELVKMKHFMTYTELSKYLNMSKPIIDEYLIKNGMKYYKVGQKYLFKRDEVDKFLDEVTESMTIKNNDFKLFWKEGK